ncbi:ATP-dependent RNA helicase DHX8 [Portunus trituberculatus]|uniref:ATP-dependent RNA helicase DHX8 n=1 Tax=Portunus trituberculatus TaxID=210409 RepID=A0A5B7F355_PORTR|nr:ATP-dependent RNA helicase DHX8 [Portunus trituberculatus]
MNKFFNFQVYEGKVTNILNFGCFVQLEGLRRRLEGLVHISQLRREGRVTNVSDVVVRGQKVKRGKTDNLPNEEFITLVVTLRWELVTSKVNIRIYSDVIDELPEKRSVLVEVLSLVDMLLALGKDGRHISCIAKQDKIDSDWDDHILVRVNEWWTSLVDQVNQAEPKTFLPDTLLPITPLSPLGQPSSSPPPSTTT